MKLNPQQAIAAQHLEGPMLVIAGAGSGKTRIIIARIEHLLFLGVPATEILAVTFTNKAAEEMRERIHQRTQTSILTTTFHSLGAKMLREFITALSYTPNFTIFDEEDSEKLLKDCFREFNIKEEKGLLKTTRLEISQAKNNLSQPTSKTPIYELYQRKLKECNAVDFDDLLFLPVQILKQFPEILDHYQTQWRFILIDEYQDTNNTQYQLIQLLSAKNRNLFAVGDPDQSIYSWRGATVDNILHFEKDFPGAKIVALEQNYRSTNIILQASNALIDHNFKRSPKQLWSSLGAGEKIGLLICDHEREEAHFVIERLLQHHRLDHIPFKECVIFYRTNFQSRLFEDAFLKHKIPYLIIGGLSFYQRKEIKDILAFLRIIIGGGDFLAFSRTINLPKRGLGETTLIKLRLAAQEIGKDLITTSHQIIERKIQCKLSIKQLEALREYITTIILLRELVKADLPLHEILSQIIERTRYLEHLKEDPETSQERRANLEELVAKAHEWDEEKGAEALTSFLEELSLKSSLDEHSAKEESVRLMTLHNGKGLEFDLCFLVGMEEDLFPHVNSKESSDLVEEERRLCYVGMTRAKKFLYFSAARHRFLWGSPRRMHPSRFLKEVPQEFIRSYNDFTPSEEGFEEGDKITHRDFGPGLIKKKYQTSLGTTYDIYFTNTNKERTLVEKFAKLAPA